MNMEMAAQEPEPPHTSPARQSGFSIDSLTEPRTPKQKAHSEALGHVRRGKSSSSGTLLIVCQLCSDTRFTSQSKSRPAQDSLIRRINSLMI
jgi:hypothetical protein